VASGSSDDLLMRAVANVVWTFGEVMYVGHALLFTMKLMRGEEASKDEENGDVTPEETA